MLTTYYEECVKYALKSKGIPGDSFKDTGLRVFQRHTANPDTPFAVLRKGGIFIPTVEASLLGDYGGHIPVVVAGVRQQQSLVEIFNPMTNDMLLRPTTAFLKAWEAAGGSCVTAFPPHPDTYHPKLIDLSNIELSTDFHPLREAIAENAHDTWAMERQSEGWTYGPRRDDEKRETPDMVPYEQLPESEKQYDRIMAEDTLKLLIALGYSIVRR